MTRAFLWLVASILSPLDIPLQAPQDEIAKLVAQLGAEKIEEREEAHQKLKSIGAAALPELKKAMKSSDPELAARAQRLVRVIEIQSTLT